MAYPAGWAAPGGQVHPPPAYAPAGGAYPPPMHPQSGGLIMNPGIPYTGQISGGMRPGKMVVIQGNIPHNANRFIINFQVGASTQPHADIAFHLSVRIREGVIVRNTLERERWGQEERTVPYQPFQFGQNFEMIIITDREEFKVAVNGQHYLGYKHRMRPLKKVDYLNISGDVTIASIKFQDEQAAAPRRAVAPPPAPVPAPVPAVAEPIMNPVTPFVGRIPNGLYLGKMIIIHGLSTARPDRFTINFTLNHGGGDKHDVIFNINVQFGPSKVICNNRRSMKWGSQEKAQYFPFQPNTNFEIIVLVQRDCYKVAVNGRHLMEFRHRIAYQQVETLHIVGDVRITQIRYQ